MKTKYAIIYGLLLMLIVCGQAIAEPVYEGFPAVRYKSFANTGSNEIYTGIADLGVGENRNELGYEWDNPAEETITFEYNPNIGAFGQLKTIDGFGELIYDLESTIGTMNAFEIIVADRDVDGQVDFKNVYVDNIYLGDFVGDGSFAAYTFFVPDYSGLNLDDGFLFTGTIELSGLFSDSSENSRVEIKTGYVPVPAAVWLLGSGILAIIGSRKGFKKK